MLEYPITRRFNWRWFTPITLVGAFFTLVFLVLLNSRSQSLQSELNIEPHYPAIQFL